MLTRRILLASGAAATLAAPAIRRATAQNAPLRIGVLLPLSGFNQIQGEPVKLGIDIAVDLVNQAGGAGGRKVEAVYRDDKANPNDALAGFRELHDMGINLFIGGFYTPLAAALIPVLAPNNAVFTCITAIGMQLTHESFDRHFFRGGPNAMMSYRAQARLMAVKYPNVTKWGFVANNNAAGADIVNAFSSGLRDFYPQLAGKQVEILKPVEVAVGATDYKPAVEQLMALGVEGLMSGLSGAAAITLYGTGTQLGFQRQVKVINDNGLEFQIGDALGKRTPNNLWSNTHWYPPAHKDVARSNAVLAEFTRHTGKAVPQGYVERGADSLFTYADAVAQAKSSDTDSVIHAMETGTFNGLKGPFHFRAEDHQSLSPLGFLRMDPTEEAPGWHVTDYVEIRAEDAVEPASPGKPFKI